MTAEEKRSKKPSAGDDEGEAAHRGGDLGPTKGAEKQQKPRSKEDILDEALEESFPASDPPAQTVPRRRSETK